jgi:hypothetical protein
MAGDTLESADTVAVVGGAIPHLVERGVIAPGALPLMEHLHEVIVLERVASMPFERFFRD